RVGLVRCVPARRVHAVGGGPAGALPQAEGRVPAPPPGGPAPPFQVRLAHLEGRRVVLEGVVEVVDGRPGTAFEGATHAAAQLEEPAQGAAGGRLDLEGADGFRALPRAAAGVDDGEAIEPSVHLEPRRQRGGGRRDNGREKQGRDCVDRPETPLYTRGPMSQHPPGKDVDRLIVAAHRRFVKAMDGRLGAMSPEVKETYFSVLSKLVTKLETNDKPLREIMQEMMTEAMSEVLQVMQG